VSNPKLQTTIENAIAKADNSYFFENYTTQAQAVIKAVEAAGFTFVPTQLPADIWQKAADQMRTGRLKPDEHVKDVYETLMRLMKG
jgi:hypothetical protein